MPPEENLSQTLHETFAQGDEWDGPWGSISPVPHSVETLCIQIETQIGKSQIHFYPYRTIGKWSWTMDVPETLEIHAGTIHIRISGTGLRRLAEALNLGQLKLVKMIQPPISTGELGIRTISIENLKT